MIKELYIGKMSNIDKLPNKRDKKFTNIMFIKSNSFLLKNLYDIMKINDSR